MPRSRQALGDAPHPDDAASPAPVSRTQALAAVLDGLSPLPPASVSTAEALGLVTAEDLAADHDVPGETRSTVDGYAVRSTDTGYASPSSDTGDASHVAAVYGPEEFQKDSPAAPPSSDEHADPEHPAPRRTSGPVRLPVHGLVRPSTAEPSLLPPGAAARILTGGVLPPGADAVVPFEEVRLESMRSEPGGPDQAVVLSGPVAPGRKTRPAGADIPSGARVARRGEELSPVALATLAYLGRRAVAVHPRPRVRVLAVGNELHDPLGEPSPGRITADNLLLLAGLLRDCGAGEVETEVCANEPEIIRDRLAACTDADLVLTTGGTGPGERDFVHRASLDAGYRELFSGVALHPGKGAFAGRLDAAGEDGRPTTLIGLPGTPPAVHSGFLLLILPVLRRLRGLDPTEPPPLAAVLSGPVRGPKEADARTAAMAEHVVACRLGQDGPTLTAAPLKGGERHSRPDMLRADGYALLPPGAAEVPAGTVVRILPVPGRFFS